MEKNQSVEISLDVNGKTYNQADIDKYSGKYSDDSLFEKVKSTIKKAGLKLIYEAMQLYYVAQKPECPMKVKAAIVATLGLFISPLDIIPDFTPVIGYADDAVAIAASLAMAQMYIDDEVRQKAKAKIVSIFGEGVLKELNS